MTYKDILNRVEQDFGQRFSVYKEKAGCLMLNPGGSLHGPDCGYNITARVYCIELPSGWSYALIDDKWHCVRNGCVGWRRGEDPFPHIPAAPANFSPL